MKCRSELRLSARASITLDDDWSQVAPQDKPGKASKYIRPFDVRPGDLVYLALRVSGSERTRNLLDERRNLRHQVKRKGGIFVGAYRHIGSGVDTGWVRKAVACARRRGASKVLAETTDRLVRNEHFNSVSNPDAQATEEELKRLVADAGGMTLMTHLHPDASPKEVRSYQRKRGQKYKGRKGGRPKRRRPRHYKARYADWPESTVSKIWRLRASYGKSIRKIAKRMDLSKSAVQRFLSLKPEERVSQLRSD